MCLWNESWWGGRALTTTGVCTRSNVHFDINTVWPNKHFIAWYFCHMARAWQLVSRQGAIPADGLHTASQIYFVYMGSRCVCLLTASLPTCESWNSCLHWPSVSRTEGRLCLSEVFKNVISQFTYCIMTLNGKNPVIHRAQCIALTWSNMGHSACSTTIFRRQKKEAKRKKRQIMTHLIGKVWN